MGQKKIRACRVGDHGWARNGKGGTRRLKKSSLSDRSLKAVRHVLQNLAENNILFFGLLLLVRDLACTLFSLACSFLNRVSPLPSILLPPMQTRRQAALNVVLPHPPLSGTGTALLSTNDSPRTPRSRVLPTKVFSPNTNRKSSDSWNSSIHEDDFATEWKPEDIRMLQRVRDFPPITSRFSHPFPPFYLAFNQTLDALPSHLLTPFNGPVPPSNLLDKIARGVAEAKGPVDWPHSQRATRAKIVELAQRRARDSTPIAGIAEESCEEEEPREVLKPSSRINRRRALYRQSSMDFIPNVELSKKDNIKDNQSINRLVERWLFPPDVAPRLTVIDFGRLSHRLQRNDRVVGNTPYHPYARPSSSPKKSASRSQLSSLNPSTPSSSTLNSSLFSNSAIKQPGLRRSFSSLSSSSDPASLYPDNPRVQKMKRADSFVASVTSKSLKRAPSFGNNSNRSSLLDTMNVDDNVAKEVPPTPGHSENQPAKRSRKRSRPMSPTTTTPAPTETPVRKSAKSSVAKPKSTKDLSDLGLGSPMVISPAVHSSPAHNTRSATKLRANVRRNPSILGGELPFPQQTPPAPHPAFMSPPSSRMSIGSDDARSLNFSPSSPTHKSLRRVKATTFGMRPIARKISFGAISEENCQPHGTAGLGLGSAFQLR